MAHPVEKYLHYSIDGEGFETMKSAYSVAQTKGFNGTLACFRDRMMAGQNTWETLLKPVSDDLKNQSRTMLAGKAKKRQAAKDEMAALMAEMDARKAAMTR